MIDIKKLLPFLFGAVLVLTLIITGFNYIASTHSVKIEYSDAKDVAVIEQKDNTEHTVDTITKSGNSVRLSNDGSYKVKYKGAEGFAGGEVTVTKSTNTINITPDYSTDRYNSLMADALPSARTLIAQKYPTVENIYSITTAGMRDRGKWLLVKLVFKGDYDYNSDNLKILLKKTSNGWQLMTKPDVILTQPSYPSIPLEILSWADTL